MTECIFTGSDLAFYREDGHGGIVMESPTILGGVSLALGIKEQIVSFEGERKLAIRRWIVEQKLKGNPLPSVDDANLSSLAAYPKWSFTDRASQLFDWLFKRGSRDPRSKFSFNGQPRKPDDDARFLAVADATSIREVMLLLEILLHKKWIEYVDSADRPDANWRGYGRITPKGVIDWEEGQLHRASDMGFVAMWFDSEMDLAHQAIFEGIADAGYKPTRVDNQEYVGGIADRIIASIRRSRFVVVDYTSGHVSDADGNTHHVPRGGVYFEAGFAEGFGVPVISTVRKDTLKANALHFDIRHLNHIVWTTPSELRRAVATRVAAVVGHGPHTDPSSLQL